MDNPSIEANSSIDTSKLLIYRDITITDIENRNISQILKNSDMVNNADYIKDIGNRISEVASSIEKLYAIMLTLIFSILYFELNKEVSSSMNFLGLTVQISTNTKIGIMLFTSFINVYIQSIYNEYRYLKSIIIVISKQKMPENPYFYFIKFKHLPFEITDFLEEIRNINLKSEKNKIKTLFEIIKWIIFGCFVLVYLIFYNYSFLLLLGDVIFNNTNWYGYITISIFIISWITPYLSGVYYNKQFRYVDEQYVEEFEELNNISPGTIDKNYQEVLRKADKARYKSVLRNNSW